MTFSLSPVQKNILFITIVTTALFSITTTFEILHADYFQKHISELTTVETITSPAEGSSIENYYYTSTPYETAGIVTAFLYMIVPALLTMLVATIGYKKGVQTYRQSLEIGVYFAGLTYILQSWHIYTAIGWEQLFGFYLVGIYGISICLGIALVNGGIYYFRKKI